MSIKVTAKNYRGQNFSRDLEKLNVITGPNGAGKTTLRLLVQEVLSGQTEDGKLAKDLFDEYGPDNGGQEEEYTIAFEKQGLMVTRSSTKKKTGSVSCKVTVNGKEMSDKASLGLLASEAMNPDDFYIGNFVKLPEEKQKKLLLSLLSQKDDIEAKKKVFLDQINTQSVKEEIQGIKKDSWIDFLIESVDVAKKRRSFLQSEKLKMNKTTEVAIEIRTEQAPQNLQSLQDDKKQKEAELKQTELIIATENGKREAYRKTEASIQETGKRVTQYENSKKELEKILEKAEDFESEIETAKAEKQQIQIRAEYLSQMLIAFGEEKKCPFAMETSGCPVNIDEKVTEFEKEQETVQAQLLDKVKEIQKLTEKGKIPARQKKELEEITAKLEELKESKLKAEKDLDSLELGQDNEMRNKQVEILKKNIEEIEEKIKSAEEAEEAMKFVEKAQEKKKIVEEEWSSSKDDILFISCEIQKHLRKTIGPLEEKINSLLATIRPAYKIIFFDENGEYKPRCRNRSGRMASLRAISGGEKASYYPAIIKAMFDFKKPKMKIMLCENSEIDGDNMVNFLRGIQENSEDLDLVIVNSWYDNFTPPTGWNHIQLKVEDNFKEKEIIDASFEVNENQEDIVKVQEKQEEQQTNELF